MRVWTAQTEDVLKLILNNKTYYPDFNLSDGLGGQNMKKSYFELLDEYKKRNKLNCEGLVFGISHLDDTQINDIEEYRDYFFENFTFWDSVSGAGEKYSILELEVPDELDLIPMYFQDFIVLGTRSIKNEIFREYVKDKFKFEKFHTFNADLNIAQGEGWTDEDILNKITQVHFHEISIDNIVNVHHTVNFITGEEYELNDTAIELKKIIDSKRKI